MTNLLIPSTSRYFLVKNSVEETQCSGEDVSYGASLNKEIRIYFLTFLQLKILKMKPTSSKNSIKKRVADLLHSEKLSDCSFRVGSVLNQRIFKAHKLILAIASTVFCGMLYDTQPEGRNSDDIVISEIEPDIFEAILNYIYTTKYTITSYDFACRLWYGFRKFSLKNAETKCIKVMIKGLNVGNCLQAYEMALFGNLRSLEKKSFELIRENATQLLSHVEYFKNVPISTMIDILSDEDININRKCLSYDDVRIYATIKMNEPSFSEDDLELLDTCANLMAEKLCSDSPFIAWYEAIVAIIIVFLAFFLVQMMN